MSSNETNYDAQQLNRYLEQAIVAAKIGGTQLMNWLGKANVSLKGPRDFVTDADLASQQAIEKHLAQQFPEHEFLGEESDLQTQQASSGSKFRWVVDPLDGTTNFVHQMPSFSVSIALQYEGQSIVGVVWDPHLEDLFTATLGGGATHNGQLIKTSRCDEMGKSLFIISLPKGVRRTDVAAIRFLNLLESAGSLRRLGSAALNLCYVGLGRADGYWAAELAIWDVAAGVLIATEAGAVIEQIDGTALEMNDPKFICAATTELLRQAQDVLSVG